MTELEKEVTDLKIKVSGLHLKIDSNQSENTLMLQKIYEQALKTNGRVNKHDDRLETIERDHLIEKGERDKEKEFKDNEKSKTIIDRVFNDKKLLFIFIIALIVITKYLPNNFGDLISLFK